MSDKSKKLKAMVGEATGQPKKEKTDKVVHYKNYKPSGITPAEFLKMAPKKFHADICEGEGTWKITYTLHKNTDNCLTYIAELGDFKESFIAPVYIFKRECGFQKKMMKSAYFWKEETAWQIICPTTKGDLERIWQLLVRAYNAKTHVNPYIIAHESYTERELELFAYPLSKYFGFGYHQPIP